MRVGSQSSVGWIVVKNWGMMSAKAVRSPLASTYNMKTVFEIPGGIVESHKWCGHFCFWGVWICSRPGHTHSGRKQHLRSGGLTCHEEPQEQRGGRRAGWGQANRGVAITACDLRIVQGFCSQRDFQKYGVKMAARFIIYKMFRFAIS